MTRLACLLRLVLVLWLPLAGLGAGLSYRLPPSDPALAAWLDAGGKLADLCRGGAPDHGVQNHCDACLQAGPALLPDQPSGSGPTARPEPVGAGRAGEAAAIGSHRLAAAARGPPVSA